jgi:hypothetical protein
MAANNNIIYPPNNRVFFDGGLNNKFDKTLIPDNESPDCQNVVFDDGAVATRLGIATMPSWVSTTVGSNVCDGLFTRIDSNNADALVSVWGGQIHAGEAATLLSEQPDSFVTGTRATAAEYEGYLFIGQSGATPYKLLDDNSTLTRHGIPIAPDSMSVATASTGTALTGDYSYKVTWVNSNLVEGDVSTFTVTHTAASENIAISNIPTAPASYGVNSRKLYRTAAGGSTYLLLTTISDNTTTTYEDAALDASLGATAPLDQGEPPNYSVSLYHQGRLFVIDPDDQLVKYSELGNPYVFKATNFIRVGDTSGDIPVALDVYDNSVVVLCQRNPWLIYMGSTSDSDWRVLRIRSPYGTVSKFGSFRFNNKVMYPAVQAGRFVGFAALEGQTISPSASLLTSTALGSDLQSTRVEETMKAVTEDLVSGIFSHVYERKAYISMPIDITDEIGNVTVATENNRVMVFDFSLGRLDRKQDASWSLWDNCQFSEFTTYRHSSRTKTQLFGGSVLADGQVRELNVEGVYQDDGATAIDSYYFTKRFSGRKQDQNLHKDFRYALILHEISETDQDMNFTYIVDGQTVGTTNVISLTGTATWGEASWGEFVWSPGAGSVETRSYTAPRFGKRIQFKFDNQNTANYHFKIYGFNYVYNIKGLR